MEEEAFDPLFFYREGEEGDYLNPYDPEDQLYNSRSSGKGDVPLQGDEDEYMEVLVTSEGEEPIGEQVAETAPVEVIAAETPPAGTTAIAEAPR